MLQSSSLVTMSRLLTGRSRSQFSTSSLISSSGLSMSILNKKNDVLEEDSVPLSPARPDADADEDEEDGTGHCQETARGVKHIINFVSCCLLFLLVVFGVAVIFLYIFYYLSE